MASMFMNETRQEGETELVRDVPMCVMAILRKLDIDKDPKYFVELLFAITKIIEIDYKQNNHWYQVDRIVEVLRYIPELNHLDSIFQSSAIYALEHNKKMRTSCQCVLF